MRNKSRAATIDGILQRDWKLAITITFKKTVLSIIEHEKQ